MKLASFFHGLPFLFEGATDRQTDLSGLGFDRYFLENEGNEPVASRKTSICY